MLIALGATLILVLVAWLCWRYLPKFGRRLLAAVALWALSRALITHQKTVPCIAIGERQGSVVIRLGTGFNSEVAYGTRFRVTNTATGEVWGIIEAVEVYDASCICAVFDRSNPHFWEELEGRMNRDASPPLGVTIRREFPEEIMDLIWELLDVWRS